MTDTPQSPIERNRDREQLLERFRSMQREGDITIPISHVVPINFPLSGTYLHILVASSDFTEQEVGNLVYVEGGSQHGDLSLIELPQEPREHFKTWRSRGLLGLYDRDEQRNIQAIYLKLNDIFRGAYQGTLSDLLRRPDIIGDGDNTKRLQRLARAHAPLGL